MSSPDNTRPPVEEIDATLGDKLEMLIIETLTGPEDERRVMEVGKGHERYAGLTGDELWTAVYEDAHAIVALRQRQRAAAEDEARWQRARDAAASNVAPKHISKPGRAREDAKDAQPDPTARIRQEKPPTRYLCTLKGAAKFDAKGQAVGVHTSAAYEAHLRKLFEAHGGTLSSLIEIAPAKIGGGEFRPGVWLVEATTNSEPDALADDEWSIRVLADDERVPEPEPEKAAGLEAKPEKDNLLTAVETKQPRPRVRPAEIAGGDPESTSIKEIEKELGLDPEVQALLDEAAELGASTKATEDEYSILAQDAWADFVDAAVASFHRLTPEQRDVIYDRRGVAPMAHNPKTIYRYRAYIAALVSSDDNTRKKLGGRITNYAQAAEGAVDGEDNVPPQRGRLKAWFALPGKPHGMRGKTKTGIYKGRQFYMALARNSTSWEEACKDAAETVAEAMEAEPVASVEMDDAADDAMLLDLRQWYEDHHDKDHGDEPHLSGPCIILGNRNDEGAYSLIRVITCDNLDIEEILERYPRKRRKPKGSDSSLPQAEPVEMTADDVERLRNKKVGSFSPPEEQRARAEEAKPYIEPAPEPEEDPPATPDEQLPEPQELTEDEIVEAIRANGSDHSDLKGHIVVVPSDLLKQTWAESDGEIATGPLALEDDVSNWLNRNTKAGYKFIEGALYENYKGLTDEQKQAYRDWEWPPVEHANILEFERADDAKRFRNKWL